MKQNLTRVFLGVAVIALTLTAASNPKATGDAGFLNGSNQARVIFNAIATSATGLEAKGSAVYSDVGGTYVMDVKYLKVTGNIARLAGRVTETTHACCSVGSWIVYEIQDNGEPGIGADIIKGLVVTLETDAVTGVTNLGFALSGPLLVNDGNLQVHK